MRETNPTYSLGIGGGIIFGGFQAEGRETCSFGFLGLRGGKPINVWGVRAGGRESQFLFGGFEAAGIVHMLKCHCAHAQLEVCTCSTGSVRMLNWKFPHAQLEACACTAGSLHMLNWNVFMLFSGRVTLNWHAHAHLKVHACSTGSVHMLKWKHAHAQLEACACAIINWKCAHAQLERVHAKV